MCYCLENEEFPLKEGPICDLQLLIIVINAVNTNPVITNVVKPTFAVEIEYDWEGKLSIEWSTILISATTTTTTTTK